MQNKRKKNGKTHKIIILSICIIIVIVAVVTAVILINRKDTNNQISESEENLIGTFYYNDSIRYEFKKNGKGAMYDGNSKYEYTYTNDGQKIKMNFKNEAVHDATYTFKLENDTLTLQGEEGTTGGEYILKKGE